MSTLGLYPKSCFAREISKAPRLGKSASFSRTLTVPLPTMLTANSAAARSVLL